MKTIDTPYISATTQLAEITVRGVMLALLLTIVLAVSNAYLALKLGILTSASIPAAMISIGILRFFKGATILENNAVQTAASAGEAVAGGIVYTIPGLIVIGYWHSFDYWTNFLIALCGGVLGVLFSIPLRRILVHERALRFPEGRAIAEVLKSSVESKGISNLLYGGLIGAALELLQVGFKVIANSYSFWFSIKHFLLCIGVGFSATMVGAGFLVGYDLSLSIFLGAVIAWFFALPIASHFYPSLFDNPSLADAGMSLWNSELRYIGIGAMLFAGIWTFLKLLRPLLNSLYGSLQSYQNASQRVDVARTEKDLPLVWIGLGIGLMLITLFFLFQFIFPIEQLGLPQHYTSHVLFVSVIYVLVFGFLFSIVTAYFSGMVGVSASPGSAVVIAGMLIAAWLLLCLLTHTLGLPLTDGQIRAAEAITIIVGSIVTGIAAIANDNSQDLKVGQLVGATPWRQQLMLLFGVVISALVIPLVMQLLFNVYGIAGVMPHEGMDKAQSLPAPTAALLAAVSEGVFRGILPWKMMWGGAGIITVLILIEKALKLHRYLKISMLGVAIGMYLPLTTSFPLFLGGTIAFFVNRKLKRQSSQSQEHTAYGVQRGMLIACGLVAGAALMDVALALIFSMLNSPDGLSLVDSRWVYPGIILGGLSMIGLAFWIQHRVCSSRFS